MMAQGFQHVYVYAYVYVYVYVNSNVYVNVCRVVWMCVCVYGSSMEAK